MYRFEEILKPFALQRLEERDGYFSCLEPAFKQQLEAFLPGFEKIRIKENNQPIDPLSYPDLPYGRNDFEWKFRQQTLEMIRAEIKGYTSANILEIGSWNGWLANILSSMHHHVLATDYFTDAQDGLGAKKYFRNEWTTLQMDLADPGIFRPGIFDVIIVNHGLQFMPDPLAYTRAIKPLLRSGGRIILTGLCFYRDPRKKKQEIAKFRQHYRDRYGFEIMIHTSKNYLDFEDKKMLKSEGFILKLYPGKWLQNIRSMLIPTKPEYCYGVFGN